MYIFRSLFAGRVRPRQSAQWHAGRHLCGEQEKLSGTNFPIGELELNEKVTTRTPASSSSSSTGELVGRARPRGWKLRAARTRIRCTPGEGWGITSHGHQAEHSNHCVCLWLFARSAKQNWPLLPARALALCPPQLTSPGFQLFPLAHRPRRPRQMQKHTRAVHAHNCCHQPLSNWRFSVMAFYRETPPLREMCVLVVCATTNFIGGWGGAWNFASCCAFICLFCVNISAFERKSPTNFFVPMPFRLIYFSNNTFNIDLWVSPIISWLGHNLLFSLGPPDSLVFYRLTLQVLFPISRLS